MSSDKSRGQVSLSSVPSLFSPFAFPARYSWTHNPPSSSSDSRHVRGSALVIASRIKAASYDGRRTGGRVGTAGTPRNHRKTDGWKTGAADERKRDSAAGGEATARHGHSWYLARNSRPDRPARVEGRKARVRRRRKRRRVREIVRPSTFARGARVLSASGRLARLTS